MFQSDTCEAYNQYHIKESNGYIDVPCPIVIVNYDFRRPLVYEKEKRRIFGVAGNRLLDIKHIGSTAVVGLGGKPIVDIMAGVNGSPVADELLPLLGSQIEIVSSSQFMG